MAGRSKNLGSFVYCSMFWRFFYLFPVWIHAWDGANSLFGTVDSWRLNQAVLFMRINALIHHSPDRAPAPGSQQGHRDYSMTCLGTQLSCLRNFPREAIFRDCGCELDGPIGGKVNCIIATKGHLPMRRFSSCQAGGRSGMRASSPHWTPGQGGAPERGFLRQSQHPSLCTPGNAHCRMRNDPRKQLLIMQNHPALWLSFTRQFFDQKCGGMRKGWKEASQRPSERLPWSGYVPLTLGANTQWRRPGQVPKDATSASEGLVLGRAKGQRQVPDGWCVLSHWNHRILEWKQDSHCGSSGLRTWHSVHEDVGSILGLAQWVKNQELLQSQMCLGYGIAVAAV